MHQRIYITGKIGASEGKPDTALFQKMLPFINTNTSIADYVWLPLRFEEDMPRIMWDDEWRIEDFE